MVGERRGDAHGERIERNALSNLEQQSPIAFEPQVVREHRSKGLDEVGLTVEVGSGVPILPADL
jgi:hypothetical protein